MSDENRHSGPSLCVLTLFSSCFFQSGQSLRITTWNVNGLRAALRKGFSEHLDRISPDVLLLQEIRCRPDQLEEFWQNPAGWHVLWNPAQRPGYSGTAIWSRLPFDDAAIGLNRNGDDPEGRFAAARIGGLEFASVYLPSGSSGPERQAEKEKWMKKFRRWAKTAQAASPLIFGGDLNIAHTESDIFYAKSNEKTSGFLPHERQWFGQLLKSGWHDLVREHYGECQGPYSWWSNRGRARELDRGWRIDYFIANPAARPFFRAANIHREAALEVSDHAPVTIDLEVS